MVICLVGGISSYGKIKQSMNPLINNYTAQKAPVVIKNASGSLADSINPRIANAIISDPNATSFRTSTTTTQIQTTAAPAPAPAPVVATPAPVPAPPAHSHPMPSYYPPSPGPVISHSHGSPYDPKPEPPAGFPHVHSGHPYIAPAVAPQRMTYQQLIEYFANTGGANLSGLVTNGSKSLLSKCKSYCDTLPASPVCDDTNVLYRNACEAKCVHKKATTNNLRYGICCCSNDDFDYENTSFSNHLINGNGVGVNFCVSTCIYNCLGQDEHINAEHVDTNSDFSVSLGSLCKNIQ